jgi:hypothetical protein
MLLGGLWHGAAWTFVLWGLCQGVLLILYRPYESAFAALSGQRRFAAQLAAWFVMFHLTYRLADLPGAVDQALGSLTASLFTNLRRRASTSRAC